MHVQIIKIIIWNHLHSVWLSCLQRYLGSLNCLIYLSQVVTKIIMLQQSFDYFESASTASLAALVVAEDNASINEPSGF